MSSGVFASVARVDPRVLPSAYALRASADFNPFRSSRSERRRVGKPKDELRETRGCSRPAAADPDFAPLNPGYSLSSKRSAPDRRDHGCAA